jgi:DNA-directed RNA polymerase specialized sigma24 family protein
MKHAAEHDEQLMAQVAHGRRGQLEPLVRRYASPLLTFIQRMVRNRHRSEELFQEVFLAVWRKRGQYEYPRPFKPWLFAIALNKCRAAFRAPPKPGPLDLEDDSPAAPTALSRRRPTSPLLPRPPPSSPRRVPSRSCGAGWTHA